VSAEAIALLARLVYTDGGSTCGHSAATVGWLHDRGYIEAWRADHWTVTDEGVSALIAARASQGATP
jgi:hypothetical protein